MLRLPSGRVVGIMSERARMHASRLQLRVSHKTPHHQLYPLIDILIETPQDSAPMGFSGYTLADAAWLREWPEADRRAFLGWIAEPAQKTRVEHARRRLLAEEGVPKERLYPYPERLYSRLCRRLQGLGLRRASGEQWLHTLKNMQQQGIRREEIEWSGLAGFLAGKGEQVIELEELLQSSRLLHIRLRLGHQLECNKSCQLPLHEVAERLPAWRMQMAGLDVSDDDVGVLRVQSDDAHYRVGVLWPHGHALAEPDRPHWFALGPYGQAIGSEEKGYWFAARPQAEEVARLHALRSHRLRCDLRSSRRYEYMSLFGGEDYREWLVTLPDYQHSHFNGHYYERNVLLHIRSKQREAVDGTRVLFIEELQSDWHQANRQQVRGQIPRAPFRREWPALAFKLMLMHAVEQGLDGIAWADGQVHELRYDRAMPGLRRLYDDELPRVARRLSAPWGAELEQAEFVTRHPWLHAVRRQDRWKVEGGGGRFVTRARYDKAQALALIERHSKCVTLGLPMLRLNDALRTDIARHGLPLFGEFIDGKNDAGGNGA